MNGFYLLLRSYPYLLLGGLSLCLLLFAAVTFFQVSRSLRYSKTKRALLSELEKRSAESL